MQAVTSALENSELGTALGSKLGAAFATTTNGNGNHDATTANAADNEKDDTQQKQQPQRVRVISGAEVRVVFLDCSFGETQHTLKITHTQKESWETVSSSIYSFPNLFESTLRITHHQNPPPFFR